MDHTNHSLHHNVYHVMEIGISVIGPRLQFFEMGVSLVSVCILLWDILHASFGEGADLSDVFMRSILC